MMLLTQAKRSRFYPVTGGILRSTEIVPGYRRIAIDGVDNCRMVFNEIERGNISNVFIEMSACEGSCINGPCIREHRERRLNGSLRVEAYGGDDCFGIDNPPVDISRAFGFLGGKTITFGNEAISAMLLKMGNSQVRRRNLIAAPAVTLPAAKRPSQYSRARQKSRCASPF